MYESRLRELVIASLVRWRRMAMSDLLACLPVAERLRLRENFLYRLQQEGLIRVAMAGDELVASITDEGEAWYRQRDQGTRPPPLGLQYSSQEA